MVTLEQISKQLSEVESLPEDEQIPALHAVIAALEELVS
jgi:uncharacterized protein YbaP (TraB family)